MYLVHILYHVRTDSSLLDRHPIICFTTLPLGCPKTDVAASELFHLQALRQVQLGRVENEYSFDNANTQNLKSGKTQCGTKIGVQEKTVLSNDKDRSTMRSKCTEELTTRDVPHKNLTRVNPVGQTSSRRKKSTRWLEVYDWILPLISVILSEG